jgi:hypothetical protein
MMQTTKRMTVERLGRHGFLNVRDLRGALQEDWVRLTSWLWPKVAYIRACRYRLVIHQVDRSPQNVRVSWRYCHFGGYRPWLHCPHCQKRVAHLFRGMGGYFCRTCLGNPVYACQAKSTHSRQHFEACKLRLKLGGKASPLGPLPERPHGMHRTTYNRICARIQHLESQLPRRVRHKTADYPNLVFHVEY